LSSIRITAFAFDDQNEAKFAAHGISARQVFQVLGNEHIILRNRKERRGSYLVIGRDDGGQCLAIPVTATADRTVWRPITAWPCKGVEEAALD
jgi:hypothetical protein